MGEFDLGKYFKSRVEGHSQELDTDAIWNSLDLDNEKKRRPKYFWMFGLSLFLVFGLLSTWVYFKQASKIQNLEKTISESAQVISEQEDATKSLLGNSPTLDVISAYQESTDESILTTKLVKKPNLSTGIKTIRNSKSNDTFKDQPQSMVEISHRIKTNSDQNNISIVNNYTSSSIIKTSASLTTNAATSNSFIGLLAFQRMESKFPQQLDYPIRKEALSFNGIQVEENVGNHFDRFSLGLYTDYNLLDRTLGSTQQSETNALLQARNSTESMLEMVSAGVELKYNVNPKWYLKSGVEIQRINERFNLNLNSIDTMEVDNAVIQKFVSAESDTIVITGAGEVGQSFAENWVNYNRHLMLNVPLTVGYKITQNRRWNVYVEGSYIVNLQRNFKGKQIGGNLNVVDQPTYFNNELNSGYAFSAGVDFKLSPNTSLYLQPRYQKMFKSFTSIDQGVSQTYQMYGLRLGLSYLLK